MKNVLVLLILSLAVLTGYGCASSSPEDASGESEESTEELHRYEKGFNPADHDSEIPVEQTETEKKPVQRTEETSLPPDAEREIVRGFRVQVTFTDNIEQANRIKTEVSSMIPDQIVYVVFESPYYKVRVGDFLNRPEANTTLRSLIEKGYKDSWIVPDKVQKQP